MITCSYETNGACLTPNRCDGCIHRFGRCRARAAMLFAASHVAGIASTSKVIKEHATEKRGDPETSAGVAFSNLPID